MKDIDREKEGMRIRLYLRLPSLGGFHFTAMVICNGGGVKVLQWLHDGTILEFKDCPLPDIQDPQPLEKLRPLFDPLPTELEERRI